MKYFTFGENWLDFIKIVDEKKIKNAETTILNLVGENNLSGINILDIGSGSGLFSLAAHRLGAIVHSFDYDGKSVQSTKQLVEKATNPSLEWIVEQGSVLDRHFMEAHENYDVVYAWGVLHHTGNMWEAMKNAAVPVKDHGLLIIAIYNDQGWISKYWLMVKRLYNRSAIYRVMMIIIHAPYLIGIRYIARFVKGKNEMERGMSLWHDFIDWIGGYPFEVAKPDDVIKIYSEIGFSLIKIITCGNRHGCNQFVFRKD